MSGCPIEALLAGLALGQTLQCRRQPAEQLSVAGVARRMGGKWNKGLTLKSLGSPLMCNGRPSAGKRVVEGSGLMRRSTRCPTRSSVLAPSRVASALRSLRWVVMAKRVSKGRVGSRNTVKDCVRPVSRAGRRL
jgi:hypothetical protein